MQFTKLFSVQGVTQQTCHYESVVLEPIYTDSLRNVCKLIYTRIFINIIQN